MAFTIGFSCRRLLRMGTQMLSIAWPAWLKGWKPQRNYSPRLQTAAAADSCPGSYQLLPASIFLPQTLAAMVFSEALQMQARLTWFWMPYNHSVSSSITNSFLRPGVDMSSQGAASAHVITHKARTPGHFQIWKHYQSIGKAHAHVLQKLIVLGSCFPVLSSEQTSCRRFSCPALLRLRSLRPGPSE